MTEAELWKALQEYVHPGNVKVRLMLFWTSNADSDPSQRLVAAADKLLKEHGLGLDVRPGVPKQAATTLPYSRVVLTGNDDQVKEVRQLADTALGGAQSILPVIFCPFGEVKGATSWSTNGVTFKDLGSPTFVFINSKVQSADGLTLLHEIGHAAGRGHVPMGPTDKIANFMSNESTRTGVLRAQVIDIANAFFANASAGMVKSGSKK
ncbi:MAG TPA: hypothetical protein VEL76_32415 [Gemmataceae bacterium]|nr:hypothetical protein [Gemmataceae bacterium]